MGWCFVAIVTRWLTCSRVWRLYARWLPVGEYGTTPNIRRALRLYNYAHAKERAWWQAGPRRKRVQHLLERKEP